IVESISRYESAEDGGRVENETATSAGAEQLTLNIIKRGEMRKKNYDPVPDIIYGLAPKGVGMLNALSTCGKTTFALGMALSAAAGKAFLNLYPGGKPVKVLALLLENEEDHWSANDQTKIETELGLTAEHKALVDENFAAVYGNLLGEEYDGDDDNLLTSPNVMKALEREIKSGGYQLVIIDTMSQAFALEKENDNGQVRKLALKPLRAAAQRTGCAFLVLHHVGKVTEDSTGHAINQARGASAINNDANAVYLLKPVGSLTKGGDRFANLVFAKARRPDKPDETPIKLAAGSRVFTLCNQTEAESVKERTGAEKFADFVKECRQIKSIDAVKDFVAKLKAAGDDKSDRTVEGGNRQLWMPGLFTKLATS
ncbi:MAG: AAA family ATPase, partial [Acidobacteriota bacterium]|nr:AAA family ATPase [Acidobacteriota bacterium]